MLDRQHQTLSTPIQIQVGVSPSMEVAAAAEGLAGLFSGTLPGMMHEEDRELELTGEVAEGSQDGGDLGGIVFVNALEPDIRIQDQELRAATFNRGPEPRHIFYTVNPKRGLQDQINLK